MNRDTYARFLRSEAYKELLLGGKKKVGHAFPFSKDFLSSKKSSTLFFLLLFGQTPSCTYICIHTYTYTRIQILRIRGIMVIVVLAIV